MPHVYGLGCSVTGGGKGRIPLTRILCEEIIVALSVQQGSTTGILALADGCSLTSDKLASMCICICVGRGGKRKVCDGAGASLRVFVMYAMAIGTR